MSLDTQSSHPAVSAAADAYLALLNNGYLRFYTASKPANSNTALSGQVLLAELRFGSPAFGASVNGLGTANAITSGSGAANGTPTWARMFKSDGSTAIVDGTVGTSGCNVNLSVATIASGQNVSITSVTVQFNEATAGL